MLLSLFCQNKRLPNNEIQMYKAPLEHLKERYLFVDLLRFVHTFYNKDCFYTLCYYQLYCARDYTMCVYQTLICYKCN